MKMETGGREEEMQLGMPPMGEAVEAERRIESSYGKHYSCKRD
ncbi:Uncharacterised protein [uncultured archaeon]|nr:Uncharacterised protein [uncultured archaeon]